MGSERALKSGQTEVSPKHLGGNRVANYVRNYSRSSLIGGKAIDAAFYFPFEKNRVYESPPGGFIAGLYARTDSSRGLWKAPADTVVGLASVSGSRPFSPDHANGEIGSEWKYVPVRRFALFIEESLYRGTKWTVF